MKQSGIANIWLFLSVLAALSSGCSASRNTLFSRTYHSLTTKYNILFNAQDRFDRSVARYLGELREDSASLIPVFPFGASGAGEAMGADMDDVLEKVQKAISLHSIKAKPGFDRMRMTPEQRQFYNRKEYNVFIDQCHLLAGKAYFMKQEYFRAIAVFQQMFELFPSERILFEAELWRIRALVHDGRLEEAGRAAEELMDNELRPIGRKYVRELNATLADLAIRQEDFDLALSHLDRAIAKSGPFRPEKKRYRFIAGQLNDRMGEPDEVWDSLPPLIEQPLADSAELLYRDVYEAYLRKDFGRVESGVQEAMAKYPESSFIPHFHYVHIVSQGARTGDYVELHRQLEHFSGEYPDSDPAIAASILLESLAESHPEISEVIRTEKAKLLFDSQVNQPHSVVLWLDRQSNINEWSFRLLNFVLDHYPQESLSVSHGPDSSGNFLLSTEWFDTPGDALKFLDLVQRLFLPELGDTLPGGIFIMSQKNAQLLQEGASVSDYLLFYREYNK